MELQSFTFLVVDNTIEETVQMSFVSFVIFLEKRIHNPGPLFLRKRKNPFSNELKNEAAETPSCLCTAFLAAASLNLQIKTPYGLGKTISASVFSTMFGNIT